MIGPAYNIVEGFLPIEQNYDSCIERLKNCCGKADLIINACMINLLNLDPVRNSFNLHALRKLYDACEVNIRNLNNLRCKFDILLVIY